MKTSNLLFIACIASMLLISCKKEVTPTTNVTPIKDAPIFDVPINSDFSMVEGRPCASAVCNASAYVVTLEGVTYTGTSWEWVWSVRNPNPGNGTNGTSQDLSHWGMQFNPCFNFASIVSAGYSADNSTWTNFNPNYAVDPSQRCLTAPVFKFNYGTRGGNKSYYKIVVNQIYSVASCNGYFKSGNRTGCCTFAFPGFSCGGGQIEE
jgi:hypothetical protein